MTITEVKADVMASVSAVLHSEKGFGVISQTVRLITWANDRWTVEADIQGSDDEVRLLGIKIRRNGPYRRLQNEKLQANLSKGWRG